MFDATIERVRQRGMRAQSSGADDGGFPGDIVEEWGMQSFPASDPPANW